MEIYDQMKSNVQPLMRIYFWWNLSKLQLFTEDGLYVAENEAVSPIN